MNKLVSILAVTIVAAVAALLILSQIEYTKKDKNPLEFTNNEQQQSSDQTPEDVEAEFEATIEQESSVNSEFDELESLDF